MPALLRNAGTMTAVCPGVAAQVYLPGAARAILTSSATELTVQVGGHREPEVVVDHQRDRHEVAAGRTADSCAAADSCVVDAAERDQQRVAVARAEQRDDRDNPVGALTVFHHHALAPRCGKALGKQPCGEIDGGAGRQRRNKPHWMLRPFGLRECRLRRYERGGNRCNAKHNVTYHVHGRPLR